MANFDYRGNELTAFGRFTAIISGGASGAAGQLVPPASLNSTGPQPAQFLSAGGITGEPMRLIKIIIAAGTGSVSVYDTINAAGAVAAALLFSVATTSPGAVYALDVPTNTGLWISVSANTQITAILS